MPEDDLDLEPMDYLHKEQHTVTFKCIGCTRDDDAQDALRYASQLFNVSTVIPVNIYPEPNNPYDRRAITFKYWINNKWTRIGYVVREILDDVHDAMSFNQITDISFAWIVLGVDQDTMLVLELPSVEVGQNKFVLMQAPAERQHLSLKIDCLIEIDCRIAFKTTNYLLIVYN